jgi:hypothetical protein
VIDFYDISGFALDVPFGEFDGCHVIDRDADLFYCRDKTDPRTDDDNTPFISLGILDHHTATDCR